MARSSCIIGGKVGWEGGKGKILGANPKRYRAPGKIGEREREVSGRPLILLITQPREVRKERGRSPAPLGSAAVSKEVEVFRCVSRLWGFCRVW